MSAALIRSSAAHAQMLGRLSKAYCNVQYTSAFGICKPLDTEDRSHRSDFATVAVTSGGSISFSRARMADWIADDTHLHFGPLQMRIESRLPRDGGMRLVESQLLAWHSQRWPPA
jgi:hypothetical protein